MLPAGGYLLSPSVTFRAAPPPAQPPRPPVSVVQAEGTAGAASAFWKSKGLFTGEGGSARGEGEDCDSGLAQN